MDLEKEGETRGAKLEVIKMDGKVLFNAITYVAIAAYVAATWIC